MADIYSAIVANCKLLNANAGFEVAIGGKSENYSDVKEWVPTSSTMLNLLLGDANFGIAVGRIFELFGDYSHGKSTVAQHIMNGFQEAGGLSVLIDSESGWDRPRAIAMGHKEDQHQVIEAETAEEGFEAIYNSIKNFALAFDEEIPIVFVWDTLASSPTDGEKIGDEYTGGMMWKPRLIRRELRRLCKPLAKNNCSLVVVNQTIEGPKPNKSGVKMTPGGGGVKFWSSQRIQVSRVAAFKDPVTKLPAGIISSAKLVKSKLNAPSRSVDLPITFSHGIDPMREVINYHLDNTSIVNIFGVYKKIIGFGEKDFSFLEKNMEKVFKENEGLLKYLVDEAKMHWLGLT